MSFNWKYGLLFLGLLFVEIFIALVVRDRFIRPFLGDVLVIGLIYCFLKTFLTWNYKLTSLGVLVFAFCIEFAQYFKLANVLGLADNKIASIILGSTFDWLDLLAYLIGFAAILLLEGRQKSLLK